MQSTVFKNSEVQWIDISEPSADELKQISIDFQLPESAVRDCLQPEHLPKYENFGGTSFFIVRHYDFLSKKRLPSAQALTRKIAVFERSDLVLTVHRTSQDWFKNFQKDIIPQLQKPTASFLALAILKRAILTFDLPLEKIELDLECLEEKLPQSSFQTSDLKKIHLLIRTCSIFKRILFQSSASFQRVELLDGKDRTEFQDLKETVEHLAFIASELHEDATNHLQLQLAIAANRTNEVMRVLMIFSVFFMPLTFIVGVYGMNFKYLPELEHPWGYPAIWVLMIAVSLSIWIWFRRKRWL